MITDTSASLYSWISSVTPSPVAAQREPSWLEQLVAAPLQAVTRLLRGTAVVPGLQRTSPSEALLGLLGDWPEQAPEWDALDRGLLDWLQQQRQGGADSIQAADGPRHFIRDYGEALRISWRLPGLTRCADWVRQSVFDLYRWAQSLFIDPTADLGGAVLAAAAHLQQGEELRFFWFQACRDAALPRQMHRLGTVLLGLSRLVPAATAPQQAASSGPLLAGFACWAAALPAQDTRSKPALTRQWLLLKAVFPRAPKFWQTQFDLWQSESKFKDCAFPGWLQAADPVLRGDRRSSRRAPLLPDNIIGRIGAIQKQIHHDGGLTEAVWRHSQLLLNQLESYADQTGDSYYLVRSCNNLGTAIRRTAPGHALMLAHRALLWDPDHAHSWSIRAEALQDLGRYDLARAVLWEARRRTPSAASFATQLALLPTDQLDSALCRPLLEQGVAMNPENESTVVELARLDWQSGAEDTALQRVAALADRGTVAAYHEMCFLLARGQSAAVDARLAAYGSRFGEDRYTATIRRLLAQGAAGGDSERRHLAQPKQRAAAAPVSWDRAEAEQRLDHEASQHPRTAAIAWSAEADLWLTATNQQQRGLALAGQALKRDPGDCFAHLVQALSDSSYRDTLRAQGSGRFAGCLPLRLVLLPDQPAAGDWELLTRSFPDRRALISLSRVVRGMADGADLNGLRSWSRLPDGNRDEGWEDALKRRVGQWLDQQTAGTLDDDAGNGALSLEQLTHLALLQDVDVGWLQPAA